MADDFSGMPADFMDQIRTLVAQQLPTDAERKQALNVGLLQGSLGLLANVRKPFLVGLGEGGQQGLLGYQGAIQQQQDMKQKALAQAGAMYSLAKQTQSTQMGIDAYKAYIASQGGAPASGSNPAGAMSDALSMVGGPTSDIYNAASAVPSAAPATSQRQAIGNLGLFQGMMKGDVMPAANFLFKDPISMRANAGYMDPQTGKFHPGMTAPPGFVFNPQTGQMQEVPGAKEAFATQAGAVTGAKEQAKAEKNLIPVPLGNGETQLMTRADAISFLQNKSSPSGGVSVGGPGQAINVQGATPRQVAQMDQDIASGGRTFQPVGQANGLTPQLGRAPSPVAMATAEAVGKGRAEYGLKNEALVDEAANAAQMDMGRNKEIRNLVTQFKPGALTPLRGEVGAIASAAGLPESIVSGIAGGSVPAIQAMGKLVVDGAFDSAKQAMSGGGRVTQAEILLKAKNSPSVPMTPEAINAMLDFKDGVNAWLTDRQSAKNEWAQAGKDPSQFSGEWNRVHSLTNYVPSAEQLNAVLFPEKSQTRTKVGGFDAQKLVDEARKRGLIK